MLQHCQVARPDQCTAEATAVGEQRDSCIPDVECGEEGEAVAVSGLSFLLAEKTVGPSNCVQGSIIYLSANEHGMVVHELWAVVGGTGLSADSRTVPGQPGLCER